jgi:hypothetical protein
LNTLNSKLLYVINKYTEDGFLFNEGATEKEIELFCNRSKLELGHVPPDEYLDILTQFNGVVVEGVFLYSTEPIKLVGSDGYSLDFIEMNLLSREVSGMEDFLFLGDSDQDVYVLSIIEGKYQVRDKQAFDNVYEEFDSFSKLFEYMVDLMVGRV